MAREPYWISPDSPMSMLIKNFERQNSNPELDHIIINNDLETELFKYLDKWGPTSPIYPTEVLTNQFTPTFWKFYRLRNFTRASEVWILVLSLISRWEQKYNGIHLHRGTPYYFLGMSEVTAGNIDAGLLFFHQALDEDNRWPGQKGWGPAWSFANLDYDNPRKAARPLLKEPVEWVSRLLSKYRASDRGSLSFAGLKRRALRKKRLKEATFSFAYVVFKNQSYGSVTSMSKSNVFASQLALDILFSVCRIVEVWIKNKQGSRSKTDHSSLGPELLTFFRNQSSTVSKKTHYDVLNNLDFDTALKALLRDGKRLFPARLQPWEADLLLVYIIRNQAGHDTKYSRVVLEKYEELLERVFFGLFKIVEALYS